MALLSTNKLRQTTSAQNRRYRGVRENAIREALTIVAKEDMATKTHLIITLTLQGDANPSRRNFCAYRSLSCRLAVGHDDGGGHLGKQWPGKILQNRRFLLIAQNSWNGKEAGPVSLKASQVSFNKSSQILKESHVIQSLEAMHA